MNAAPITAVLCGDLNLVRCFAGKGLAIALVGSDADDPALASRYLSQRALIACPLADPQQALADLVALGKTLPGRPALFYDSDPMLLLVSRGREALEPYYRFLAPEAELVEDLASKVRFADLARRLDLPVPRTVMSREMSSAREAEGALTLPCIFKPISHAGWYSSEIVQKEGGKPWKALLAASREEFHRRWEDMSRFTGEFVVQDYIPGADDCIYSVHAYLDRRSRPLGAYVGRKIRTYPKVSGVSTYLELIHDPALLRLGLDILAKLGFVGPAKLDFKKDPLRDRLYLLEINPRYNLWHHLGAASGVNLPYMAYRDLYGEGGEPATEVRTGVRWLSFPNDLRAFVRDYHPDGDLSWGDWLWSLRGEKVYNVFSWSDPLPFARAILQDVSSRVRALSRRAQRERRAEAAPHSARAT